MVRIPIEVGIQRQNSCIGNQNSKIQLYICQQPIPRIFNIISETHPNLTDEVRVRIAVNDINDMLDPN